VKYLLIRDDDISSFTERRFIEKIYGPLLGRGIPVNFAVIPQIATDIKYGPGRPFGFYYKKFGLSGSPDVPPQYRGKDLSVALDQNDKVISYLLQFPHVEILQHGYTHGFVGDRNEFDIRDSLELKKRIQTGKRILTRIFGKIPEFFTAPRDSISLQAIRSLKKEFKGLSLWRLFNWKRVIGNAGRTLIKGSFSDFFLPLQTFPLHKKIKKRKDSPYLFMQDFLILLHPGCLLSRFLSREEMLRSIQNAVDTFDVVTLVNHHWEYFFDWADLDQDFYDAWREVVDLLVKRDDVEFVTFSGLYKKLHVS